MCHMRPQMFSEEIVAYDSNHGSRKSRKWALLELLSSGCDFGNSGGRSTGGDTGRFGARSPTDSATAIGPPQVLCFRLVANIRRIGGSETYVSSITGGRHRAEFSEKPPNKAVARFVKFIRLSYATQLRVCAKRKCEIYAKYWESLDDITSPRFHAVSGSE
jgi:hypothetical protein